MSDSDICDPKTENVSTNAQCPLSKMRKTWSELRGVVKNARKLQMTLSNAIPHSFNFRPIGDESRFRLYFLGVPSGARENTLLYVDVDAGQKLHKAAVDEGGADVPAFQPLISFQGPGTTYTKEEQLLRERKRVGSFGITAYDYDAASRSFAFSCGSSVFSVVDEGKGVDCGDSGPPFAPQDVTITSPGGSCLDPKICPGFPNLIGFVRSGDLWVASTGPGGKSPRVTRLTDVEGVEGVTAGTVSFVVQEEFDRYTGYWWRPPVGDRHAESANRSGSAMHLDLAEDEETMTSSVSSHQILYEEADESGVETIHIVSSTEDRENHDGFDKYKYPRVGSANAKTELKIVDFVYDSGTGAVAEVEELRLETPLEEFYPEMEYLVRAGWTPDGKYIWAQVVNRKQSKLALILIHPHAFVRVKDPTSPSSIRPNSTPSMIDEDMLSIDELPSSAATRSVRPPKCHCASTSPIHVPPSQDESDDEVRARGSPWGMWLVYEESSPSAWINVNDNLRFVSPPAEAVVHAEAEASNAAPTVTSTGENDGAKRELISFVWGSEKSGFNHLYLITVTLPQVPSTNICSKRDVFAMGSGPNRHRTPTPCPSPDPCPIVSQVALTQGEWEVQRRDVWFNPEKRLLFFIATKETPLENHLYSVSIDCPISSVTRLTEPGFTHAIFMDLSCKYFVSISSSLAVPPHCRLFAVKESESYCLATLMKPVTLQADYEPPLLFSYRSQRSGQEQYGLFYMPADVKPGERRPTVLFVYGGPQVQLVTNSFKGLRFLRLHSMASLGFAVLVLDVRGSFNRGLQFEAHLKHQMGCVEVEDHVEGLHHAAHHLPEARDVIDLSRVAIHGWSYGGYLSLMALAQRPDVFKVALAGAPVTSWQEYDTGYTERYMGQLDENESGYEKGSVLSHVNEFPDEENRLLIIHGLIDENVHFRHTSLIINALIKACKPYQLQIYPNERHGIRQPDTSEHYETNILSFLLQHL